MENGKLSSVGEKVSLGGQERTREDENNSGLTTSESIPLFEAVTLILPISYKTEDFGQLYAALTSEQGPLN